MIDLGISKMALIGAVALIVIGPEKLPRVARTVGNLIGRAQRYVSDVKNEVNRSMELEELKKMQEQMKSAVNDVEKSVQTTAAEFNELGSSIDNSWESASAEPFPAPVPEYRHPKKNFRLKRGATPQWYKARNGVRTKAQSGAARVARFRPYKPQ
jgi:sec-independent protein translocase protein TatB